MEAELLCNALNRLLWKLPNPGRSIDEFAEFMVAELQSGPGCEFQKLRWNAEAQRFEMEKSAVAQ